MIKDLTSMLNLSPTILITDDTLTKSKNNKQLKLEQMKELGIE